MATSIITMTQAREIKVVQVKDTVLALCAVKAAHVDQLTIEECEALVNWCSHQQSDLWEDMSLQEILNVYRATAEWDTFEAWAQEDREAACAAWNAAVIDEGNKLEPRDADDGGC